MPMRPLLQSRSEAASAQRTSRLQWCQRAVVAGLTATLLAACGTGYKPPQPAPLPENPGSGQASVLWRNSIGAGAGLPLQIATQGNQIVVANAQGGVHAFGSNGAPLWTFNANRPLAAGIGFDGSTAAVVTDNAELVAIRNGNALWRVPLPVPSYTAPLVSGGRVFVLGADNSIAAHDGANGYTLWQRKSQGSDSTLVVRQSSLLFPAGGLLMVGAAGRIVALNPDNGKPVGEVPLAGPRGSTELAQAVTVLTPASRQGNSVCARVFHTAVGCANLGSGAPDWVEPTVGSTGISGDGNMVVGADNNGIITAWARGNGKQLWKNETLRYRKLSAPLVVGNSVVIGDAQGNLHVLARDTGAVRNRIRVDDGAIQVAPVLFGNAVVVVTSKGTVAALAIQ